MRAKPFPSVCVVILNYNGRQITLNCVESVLKLDYPNFSVIVVDNASADDSVARFKEAFTDPRIEILVNDKNEGYAGGNNRGVAKALAAGADYIFILNNDTIVEPGCLTPLVEAMEGDRKVGIVGCPGFDGRPPDSSLCFLHQNFFTMRTTRLSTCPGERELGEFDFVSGAAFLIRAETAAKTGMFDESFFLYWEDADLCFRARRAGYKLKVVASPGVQHLVSETIKRVRPLYTFCSTRNRVWLVRRHGTAWHQIVFNLYAFSYLYPRAILGRLRGREFHLLAPIFRAIWHGHCAYPGYYPRERPGL